MSKKWGIGSASWRVDIPGEFEVPDHSFDWDPTTQEAVPVELDYLPEFSPSMILAVSGSVLSVILIILIVGM